MALTIDVQKKVPEKCQKRKNQKLKSLETLNRKL